MDIIQIEKHCGRCGHTWISQIEKPARCPHCGTYHWHGESVTYTCLICGHSWFSRTNSTPARCPGCKTRSWNSEPKRYHACRTDADLEQINRVKDMYLNGMGCVSIALETGIPLARIVEMIRIAICDGHTPKM